MASFSVIGFIDSIKIAGNGCLLFLSEFKKGYRKQGGESVCDRYVSWKVVFPPYFKKYLTEHFGNGMLVEVKGEVLPYAVEHGTAVDGISVFGQCVNLFSYPRSAPKSECRMVKDGDSDDGEMPDVGGFTAPDF